MRLTVAWNVCIVSVCMVCLGVLSLWRVQGRRRRWLPYVLRHRRLTICLLHVQLWYTCNLFSIIYWYTFNSNSIIHPPLCLMSKLYACILNFLYSVYHIQHCKASIWYKFGTTLIYSSQSSCLDFKTWHCSSVSVSLRYCSFEIIHLRSDTFPKHNQILSTLTGATKTVFFLPFSTQ